MLCLVEVSALGSSTLYELPLDSGPCRAVYSLSCFAVYSLSLACAGNGLSSFQELCLDRMLDVELYRPSSSTALKGLTVE